VRRVSPSALRARRAVRHRAVRRRAGRSRAARGRSGRRAPAATARCCAAPQLAGTSGATASTASWSSSPRSARRRDGRARSGHTWMGGARAWNARRRAARVAGPRRTTRYMRVRGSARAHTVAARHGARFLLRARSDAGSAPPAATALLSARAPASRRLRRQPRRAARRGALLHRRCRAHRARLRHVAVHRRRVIVAIGTSLPELVASVLSVLAAPPRSSPATCSARTPPTCCSSSAR
jgi:hypothetical protein